MENLGSALTISASGMRAQATRLQHVAENISNADTPGYQRKVIAFSTEADTGGVLPGPVNLDRSPRQVIHDPGHPLADENGNYESSNVDMIIEIADAREAQRSYEANLRLFDQARQMTSSLFELLRR